MIGGAHETSSRFLRRARAHGRRCRRGTDDLAPDGTVGPLGLSEQQHHDHDTVDDHDHR
jgi:hypothetical protein